MGLSVGSIFFHQRRNWRADFTMLSLGGWKLREQTQFEQGGAALRLPKMEIE